MPNLLEIDEFVFETQALKDALNDVSNRASTDEKNYSDQALRAALRYFADWGSNRARTLNDPAVAVVDGYSAEEKRETFNTITRRLSSNLSEQYNREVDQQELEQFFHHISGPTIPSSFATFLVRYCWETSGRIHSYRRDLQDRDVDSETEGDRPEFVDAVRSLPGPYLDKKSSQYEGDDRVNGIRYRVLELLRSDERLSARRLDDLIQEENAQYGRNIMQGFTNFTVLGQLYHDYYKPRLNIYLEELAQYFLEESNVSDSTTHTVDYSEPRHQLDDFAWLAIYPAAEDSQADAYQLYLGWHWDHLSIGLHVGDNLRDGEWKQTRDLDRETSKDVTAKEILQKFQSVRDRYHSLNNLEGGSEPPEKPPRADVVERQLESANQVVFYGPPGTGKTFEAKRFAEWWVHERTEGEPTPNQIQSVTFHPSYAYEDFVEGLTAEATDDGDVAYEIDDGILKSISDDAREAFEAAEEEAEAAPFVLIVDEINRGNIAQIFGELITLLEADKRGGFETELAHSGETFTLPPNLYLIGTMNTADQSIALVDTALRRRFRFVDFPPSLDVIFAEDDSIGASANRAVTRRSDDINRREQLLGASVLAVEELNDRILGVPDLGKGKQLGHAYLMELDSPGAVVDAWRYDILPQLEEYYFGQFERLRESLLQDTDDHLVDWEAERIRAFGAEELYSALCTLAGVEDPAPLEDATAETRSDGSGIKSTGESADQWDDGEYTVDAFRERIHRRLDAESAEKVERILDTGEEIGRLDPGTGDVYAKTMLKSDAVDPNVNFLDINQDGELSFSWGWLKDREENDLTGDFLDEAATVFEDVDGYEHEWDPDDGEAGTFHYRDLNVSDLSEEDMTALIEGLQTFVDRASEFQNE
jgi:5-methylcytosine-specific restriction protein B